MNDVLAAIGKPVVVVLHAKAARYAPRTVATTTASLAVSPPPAITPASSAMSRVHTLALDILEILQRTLPAGKRRVTVG
jgi:hypothetical protein